MTVILEQRAKLRPPTLGLDDLVKLVGFHKSPLLSIKTNLATILHANQMFPRTFWMRGETIRGIKNIKTIEYLLDADPLTKSLGYRPRIQDTPLGQGRRTSFVEIGVDGINQLIQRLQEADQPEMMVERIDFPYNNPLIAIFISEAVPNGNAKLRQQVELINRDRVRAVPGLKYQCLTLAAVWDPSTDRRLVPNLADFRKIRKSVGGDDFLYIIRECGLGFKPFING